MKLTLLSCYRDASLNAEDMASQSVRLKEEQLRKEEEKVILWEMAANRVIDIYIFIIASFVRSNKRSNVRSKKRELSSWARKKLCVTWKLDWPKPRSLMSKEATMCLLQPYYYITQKKENQLYRLKVPSPSTRYLIIIFTFINPLYPQFLMVTYYQLFNVHLPLIFKIVIMLIAGFACC